MLVDLLMACVTFVHSGEVWLCVLAGILLRSAARPAAEEYVIMVRG